MNQQGIWFSDYKSKQGNIGLGQAIAYYMSQGYIVLLPINDTQPYDLAVDKLDGNGLQRVSVKTTRHQSNNLAKDFIVKISSSSGMKRSYTYFKQNSCDLMFVLSINSNAWEIPVDVIKAKTSFTLNEEYNKYKIF